MGPVGEKGEKVGNLASGSGGYAECWDHLTHVLYFQGDCEDGMPGLPGQAGTPGERVNMGARDSGGPGHGMAPTLSQQARLNPHAQTTHISEPPHVLLSGPTGTSWSHWPQSEYGSGGQSPGAGECPGIEGKLEGQVG